MYSVGGNLVYSLLMRLVDKRVGFDIIYYFLIERAVYKIIPLAVEWYFRKPCFALHIRI